MLTLNDLPPGYSMDPAKSTDEKRFCDYKSPAQPQVSVSHDFTKGGGLSTVSATTVLRQYASPAAVHGEFAAMVKTLKTCKSETINGHKGTYSLMSAPHLGDESAGVRVDVEGATVLEYFVADGPTLVTVGIVGLVNSDVDQLGNLLRKQVAAYEDAASR